MLAFVGAPTRLVNRLSGRGEAATHVLRRIVTKPRPSSIPYSRRLASSCFAEDAITREIRSTRVSSTQTAVSVTVKRLAGQDETDSHNYPTCRPRLDLVNLKTRLSSRARHRSPANHLRQLERVRIFATHLWLQSLAAAQWNCRQRGSTPSPSRPPIQRSRVSNCTATWVPAVAFCFARSFAVRSAYIL